MQTVEEKKKTAEAVTPEDMKEFVAPAPKPFYEFGKRVFDIVASFFGLIVLSPVFLITAIAIWWEDHGTPFYSQTRLTKGGKEFKMYKFRSMCMDADKMLDSLLDKNEMTGPAFKIAADPRITKIGPIIRRASIDELPQLVNILKGDMSVIGPRPPLPREVAQYTPYQMHRLDVKTGLACYHECMGRNDNPDFDEWVESDLKYIRERSLWVDFKVILMTIKVVLTGKGAM